MLPFLKNYKEKSAGGVTVQMRKPDHPEQEEKREENQEVEAAAQDLLNAIAANDVRKVAAALQAAFEICDSLPHEEGPHIEAEDEE